MNERTDEKKITIAKKEKEKPPGNWVWAQALATQYRANERKEPSR